MMRLKATLIGVGALALIVGSQPASAQWTGCGAGVHGGLHTAALDVSPITIGSSGQAAGLSVNCDYRMQAFVAGVFAEYDWIFGDTKTLGAKTDLTLGGRLGVLINQGSLLYTHAGWSRVDLGGGDIDGWKLGLGNEFRIPNSPLYLDLRYTYAHYDTKDLLGPGAPDVVANEFRVGVNVKFGPGMFGGAGNRFETDDAPAARAPAKKACDPKLASC